MAEHPVDATSVAADIPRATYRLQFHKDFTFDDAVRVLPYLQRLGISHVYCSPILRARPGSTHGYDVVAHDEINPELGGAEGFERFSAALQSHGMGQLLDMVPNHMGVFGADNAWWMDVLENGPASAYAHHFDIDWQPVNPDLHGKVLVPVLGDHYGDVLDSGQLVVGFEPETGTLVLRYHEHRFPLDPCSYPRVLRRALKALDDGPVRAELESMMDAFVGLPSTHATDRLQLAERESEKEKLKLRMAALSRSAPGAIEAAVAALNAAEQRDELHALHEAQAYRLAYWRVAADEINYRRFFDINSLAALRMEEPAVFEATQGLALDLAAAGKVQGLRIDHPDGLHDPAQYFDRLQQGFAQRKGIQISRDAKGRLQRPLYVVAEKIAAPHEDVPDTWAIHGTTGYRFAMVVNGVLVDTAAAKRFDRIWQGFSGDHESYEELCYQGKRAIMRNALASELTVLATALQRIARSHRRTRDYTFNSLRSALADVAACMPVYRTYIVDSASPQDLRFIDWALAHAKKRSALSDPSIFDFVRQAMLGQAAAGASAERVEAARQFAMRLQQFCAPVAAKGVEDTAFYRYHRLGSLSEVGGDPSVFGITPRAFHGASADRALRWPHTILATSTHDNKRSEDVRNRINVLSETPAAWRLSLRRWSTLARNLHTEVDGVRAPSAADEYLLYQTLLGTLPAGGLDETSLPAYRQRIEAYMVKAAREAKARTSWTRPDEAYEAALAALVHGVLARLQPNPLLTDLQARASEFAWFGALNTLSMVLLKFTSPGVPDLYQGNELMDLSLVDPDNRRPVDFALRTRWLDELSTLSRQAGMPDAVQALAAAPHDGRAKLWLTWQLLALRQELPQLFSEGNYKALNTRGERRDHVLAFARRCHGRTLVVVAGRLFAQLMKTPDSLPIGPDVWRDTAVIATGLAEGTVLRNVVTGESVRIENGAITMAQAFAHFPAAAFITEA
jgi:(1->4)-alpha-D-glucan 1-alpha-D-glucosylmutase